MTTARKEAASPSGSLPAGLQAELDPLYEAAPSEFTAARNSLVRYLRQQGRKTDAATVQRLRRPSAPVWALNQVARREPPLALQFAGAVDRLQRVQLQGRDIAPLIAEQRRLLREMVQRAEGLLRAAGLAASAAVLQRVSSTAAGAAADPGRRDDFLHGRLDQELGAPGFEVLAGAMPPRHAAAPAAVERPPRTDRSSAEAVEPSRSRKERDGAGDAVRRSDRQQQAQGDEASRPERQTPRQRLADQERRVAHERQPERGRQAERERRAAVRQAVKAERAARQRQAAAARATRTVDALRGRLLQAERRAQSESRAAEQAVRVAERARRDVENADARFADERRR